MSFKCGIIGLPNVGKSTIFNAITSSNVQTKNYPFCTIKPNIGIAQVSDKRLKILSQITGVKKTINAKIEFVDIAGLIQGSYKGEGLGNQFLSKIRESDVIVHVLRFFKNKEISHISEIINPYEDARVINSELLLSDISLIDNMIAKLNKNNNYEKIKIYEKLKKDLSSNKFSNLLNSKLSTQKILKEIPLLVEKPMFYIANMEESQIKNNISLDSINNKINQKNSIIIKICASSCKFKDIKTQDNKNKIINKIKYENLQMHTIQKIINTGYEILKLNTFFTINKNEICSWTIKNNTTAIEASKKIHSDMQKGFIKAEVINFNDYIKYKGYKECKKAGKIKIEGKNYIINDGEIIKFRFNV